MKLKQKNTTEKSIQLNKTLEEDISDILTRFESTTCDSQEKIVSLFLNFKRLHELSSKSNRYFTTQIKVSWNMVNQLMEKYNWIPDGSSCSFSRPMGQTTNRWPKSYYYQYIIHQCLGGIVLQNLFGCPTDQPFRNAIYNEDGQHKIKAMCEVIFRNESVNIDEFHEVLKEQMEILNIQHGDNPICEEFEQCIKERIKSSDSAFTWRQFRDNPTKYPILSKMFREDSITNFLRIPISFSSLRSLNNTLYQSNHQEYGWSIMASVVQRSIQNYPDYHNKFLLGDSNDTDYINEICNKSLTNLISPKNKTFGNKLSIVMKMCNSQSVMALYHSIAMSKIDGTENKDGGSRIDLSDMTILGKNSGTKQEFRRLTFCSLTKGTSEELFIPHNRRLNNFDVYYKKHPDELNDDILTLLEDITKILGWADSDITSDVSVLKDFNSMVKLVIKGHATEFSKAEKNGRSYYKSYKGNLSRLTLSPIENCVLTISHLISTIDNLRKRKVTFEYDKICSLFYKKFHVEFENKFSNYKEVKTLKDNSYETRYEIINDLCDIVKEQILNET